MVAAVLQASGSMVASWSRPPPPCLQGTRAALWKSLVSILAKLGTLQMEQLRNQALVILQRSVSPSCILDGLCLVR